MYIRSGINILTHCKSHLKIITCAMKQLLQGPIHFIGKWLGRSVKNSAPNLVKFIHNSKMLRELCPQPQ